MNKYKNNVSKFNFMLSKAFFYSTRCIRFFQYVIGNEYNKSKAIINGIRNYNKIK